MPNIPGAIGDVFFGDAERPLPDWRKAIAEGEPETDDDEPTPEERRAVAAILGFDPAEETPE